MESFMCSDKQGSQLNWSVFIGHFLIDLTLVPFERKMLPRKKQRALEEMEIILGDLINYTSKEHNQKKLEYLIELKKIS